MHIGGSEVACRGVVHGLTAVGGENRTGGEANGIPRYWLTATTEEGTVTLDPTTTPEESTTVGGTDGAMGLDDAPSQ